VDADGGHQVRDETDPVAIASIEPEPQDANSSPPREVGEKRGLAVPSLGDEQHDAAMDLDGEPVEQSVAGEDVLAKRRRLDLAELDRVVGRLRRRSAPDDDPGAALPGAFGARSSRSLPTRRRRYGLIGRRGRSGGVA
jgi:hypothetical protein